MSRVIRRFAGKSEDQRAVVGEGSSSADYEADVARKNSWQLAEHVGHRWAHRLEWLLGGASWDADALRDAVRDYVVEHLGSPDGVLIADTQVIKKGVKSVGVAPQYCGATGQVENCQVMPIRAWWRVPGPSAGR